MSQSINLRSFVDAAGDAMIAVNRAGILVLWNPAAERLFGRPAAAAIGKSLDLIIPEKSRDAHWQGFRETMRTEQTRLGGKVIRVPALHQRGHQIRIALTVAVLRDDEQRIAALGAVIREETA